MKTFPSSKFVSIAAFAAALFTSGSIARAGEVFRTSIYVGARAPIAAPVACRPAYAVVPCPVRPVVIARGGPAPVCGYPAPRPVAPVVIRDGGVGRPAGFWGRR